MPAPIMAMWMGEEEEGEGGGVGSAIFAKE